MFRELFFSGYNLVNTLVYGLLLGILGLLAIKVLRKTKFKIKIDNRLYSSITPYIILASIIRVLIDSGTIPFSLFLVGFLGIVTFGGLFLFLLVISLLVQRRWEIGYHKPMLFLGMILVSFTLPWIRISNPKVFITLPFTLLLTTPLLLAQKSWQFLSKNLLPLSSNIFNSVTNFVGSYFGYGQKHVVQRFWVSTVGNPLAILGINILVAFPILYGLELLEEDYRRIGRLIIFALTLGSGLRNLLRIGMGV